MDKNGNFLSRCRAVCAQTNEKKTCNIFGVDSIAVPRCTMTLAGWCLQYIPAQKYGKEKPKIGIDSALLKFSDVHGHVCQQPSSRTCYEVVFLYDLLIKPIPYFPCFSTISHFAGPHGSDKSSRIHLWLVNSFWHRPAKCAQRKQ